MVLRKQYNRSMCKSPILHTHTHTHTHREYLRDKTCLILWDINFSSCFTLNNTQSTVPMNKQYVEGMQKTEKRLTWLVWLISPFSSTTPWQSKRHISPVQRTVAKESLRMSFRDSHVTPHETPNRYAHSLKQIIIYCPHTTTTKELFSNRWDSYKHSFHSETSHS